MQDDFITKLKSEYNLAEIVGSTHELRDVGRGDYVGKCPFHPEDTASFRVNHERFHCFGCHIHGDIFSWLQRIHGVTFPQAMRMLSKKDIPIPEKGKRLKKPKTFSSYDAKDAYRIMQMNEIVQDFYCKSLAKGDKETREYIDSRISIESQKVFGIGYAPLNSDRLIDKLLKRKYSHEEILKASITASNSKGEYYARLRDRISIPLYSQTRSILGFAGRAIEREGAEKPSLKYINPPDTSAFAKRRFLYGAANGSSHIGIVEGYLDVISLYDKGVRNVCSIMGTFISPEQVQILDTLGAKVWTMLDGDMPGLKASVKVSCQLLENGIEGSVLLLSNKDDPDTVCKKVEDVKQYLRALPRVNFKDFHTQVISIPELNKQKWDRSILDNLSQRYVDDNIRSGYSHYNVIQWVISAYPDNAPSITSAMKQMVEDPTLLPDGTKQLKEEHVKAFLKAWIVPCREVRLANDKG